jgi:hypothetical protein
MMKRAVKEDQVSSIDLAYLTDRVLVNQGNPQIYGTQFYRDKNSRLVPRPIWEAEKLDERRKKAGLGTFKLYKRKVSYNQAKL